MKLRNLETMEKKEDKGLGADNCRVNQAEFLFGGSGLSRLLSPHNETVIFELPPIHLGEYISLKKVSYKCNSCEGFLEGLREMSRYPRYTVTGEPTFFNNTLFQQADKNGTINTDLGSPPSFAVWDSSIQDYSLTVAGNMTQDCTSSEKNLSFKVKLEAVIPNATLSLGRSGCPPLPETGYSLSRNSVGAFGANPFYVNESGCSISYEISPNSSVTAEYGILQTMEWPDLLGFVNPRNWGKVREKADGVIDCSVDLSGKCVDNKSIKNVVEVIKESPHSTFVHTVNTGAVFTAPYVLMFSSKSISPFTCYKALNESREFINEYVHYTSYLMMKIKGENNSWVPIQKSYLKIGVGTLASQIYQDCYAYCESTPCGVGAGVLEDPFQNPWKAGQLIIDGPSSSKNDTTLPKWNQTTLSLDKSTAVVALERDFDGSKDNFYYYCNWAYDKEYCPDIFSDLISGATDNGSTPSCGDSPVEYDTM